MNVRDLLLVGRQSIADVLADQRDILSDIRDVLKDKKRAREEEEEEEEEEGKVRDLLLRVHKRFMAKLPLEDKLWLEEEMSKLGLSPAK